jgi:hypothetical protein
VRQRWKRCGARLEQGASHCCLCDVVGMFVIRRARAEHVLAGAVEANKGRACLPGGCFLRLFCV